jgi:hypothetical protein
MDEAQALRAIIAKIPASERPVHEKHGLCFSEKGLRMFLELLEKSPEFVGREEKIRQLRMIIPAKLSKN